MTQGQGGGSSWNPTGSQPPNAGTTEEGEVISFKENTTREDDHLVSAGDYSADAKGFDENHDHTHPEGYKDKGAMDNPVYVDSITEDTEADESDDQDEDANGAEDSNDGDDDEDSGDDDGDEGDDD